MQEITYHKHTGTDAPRISGKDLDGFMIFEAVPTHKAPQGTLVVGKDSSTYKLYCMINGSWTAL
jgi:hypothetical protein